MNDSTIYTSHAAEAVLTTESAASSYGRPVLRVTVRATGEALDLGPADPLPSGLLTAGDLVGRFLSGTLPDAGPRTDEALDLAARFVAP